MTSLLNGYVSNRAAKLVQNIFVRYKYQPKSARYLGPRPSKKLKAQSESIRAKGFLRPIKAYEPPSDASRRVESICGQAGLSTKPSMPLDDPEIRFNILRECHSQFSHAVPNSQLHSIETVGDLMTFYKTPVVTTTPYDAFKTIDLPQNIHVQYDYVRYHPDTDTMFNGISAFPKTSNLVTGLKTRKKYAGFKHELPWYKVAKNT